MGSAKELPIACADRLERYRDIVPDWESFLEALSRPLPQCIWTNTLLTSPDRLASLLSAEQTNRLAWHPGAFKGPAGFAPGYSLPFIAGWYHTQEEVSLLPAFLLDPRPGERILDLCAAPGNKSAQIAVAMENSGTVVANDRDGIRMRAVRGIFDRLGIINATLTVADAVNFPLEAGLFDRVLADVPCTCEGTTRKHPAALIDSGRDPSLGMHGQQSAILRRAVQLCRPGGCIVYATCTYAPEENEMVVDRILAESGGDLSLLPARLPGFVSSPGLTSWCGRELESSLSNAMRVWPHQNDTGGFFVAVFLRGGDGPVGGDVVAPGPEAETWIGMLVDRFGIEPAVFKSMALLRPSNKYVTVTSRDHRTVHRPDPVTVGMPLIRSALKYPKLTTPGARLLGRDARRNVIDVTRSQADRYLARENFEPWPEQRERLTDTGYVIVMLQEIALGVGIFHAEENRVSSMFPMELSRGIRAE
ncbi:MAG TPA: RsmB/NOP family class I SAM-dependent RNA methyltransferase [Rhodothermales bacterium]|nr:RsmB/NOP family class I SAM-dependent RNA methyltransferase [Rhodothermales bacterium]